MSCTNLSQYEDEPAIHTVQRREGGDDDNANGTHAVPEGMQHSNNSNKNASLANAVHHCLNSVPTRSTSKTSCVAKADTA